MMKITPDDLVRYLYNETSAQKTSDIKAALQIDSLLRDEYEKLKNTHFKLDEVCHSPRQETINSILEYAAKKHKQLHSI